MEKCRPMKSCGAWRKTNCHLLTRTLQKTIKKQLVTRASVLTKRFLDQAWLSTVCTERLQKSALGSVYEPNAVHATLSLSFQSQYSTISNTAFYQIGVSAVCAVFSAANLNLLTQLMLLGLKKEEKKVPQRVFREFTVHSVCVWLIKCVINVSC